MVKKRKVTSSKTSKNNERSSVHKCPHCHGAMSLSATFCPHCGTRAAGMVAVAHTRCKRCRQIVEATSAYCKYCGAPVAIRKNQFFNFLGYVIAFVAFLVLVYAVLESISTPKIENGLAGSTDAGTSIRTIALTGVNCDGRTTQARLCANAEWEENEGDVVTATVGTRSVATLYSSGYFCVEVGNRVGEISAALVNNGVLVDADSSSYSCEMTVEQKSTPTKTKSYVTESVQFRADQTYGRGRGEGVFTVHLGAYPKSCNIEGSFVTDNQNVLQPRRECDLARGTFTGYFDAYTQSVVTDPGLFYWSGLSKGQEDPPPQTFDGYAIYMHMCDALYYSKPRYPVEVVVSKFGRDPEFTWKYYNEDTMPAVEFDFDLICEV